MLTVPWTTTRPLSGGGCAVLAGRLPLRSRRDLPAVLAELRRTRRHLATAPGVAGHAAAIEVGAPALWLVSAWTSRADLVRFEHSAAHQAAQATLRPRLRPATFVVWTCPAADLPVTWVDVRRRIDAAPLRPEGSASSTTWPNPAV